MIELSLILSQLILFIFLFAKPTIFLVQNIKPKRYFEFYENIVINLLIYLNLILILSFLNFKISEIISIYLATVIFFYFLIFFKKNLFELKNSYFNYKILFVTFLCIIIFFDIASNLSLSWDTEKFWFLKVLNFSNGQKLENLADYYRSHYPHFFDLMWAFFWKLSLIDHEYAGRLFYGFFYVISICLLANTLKANKLIKLISVMFIILCTYNYYEYLSGNKEIIIFSLISIIVYFIYNIREKIFTEQSYIFETLMFLLASNLLIWVKQEGFIYLLNIIFALTFFLNINLTKKIMIIFFCLAFYFLKILIYKFYNFNLDLKSCCYYDFTADGILNKLTIERLFYIIFFIIYVFFKNPILIIGLYLGIIGCLNKKFFIKNIFIYSIILTSLVSIVVIFIMTDANLEQMLKHGIERLIFNLIPIFVIMIIEYFNYFYWQLDLKKNKY